MNDLEGVCLSTFTGCQLPFYCSTAAQCEAAAAVADLGELVLCKAAALLVVEHGNGATFLQNQPDRRCQVLIERACVQEYCFVLHCLVFCVLCMCDGGGGRGAHAYVIFLCLSHRTTVCGFHKCVSASLKKSICGTVCSLAHQGSGCGHSTVYMSETVCVICKCQCKWHVNIGSEEVLCCVTVKEIYNLEASTGQTNLES